MFRAGARVALRSQNLSSLAPARTAARRYASTDPPHLKSRTFKNSLLRWGLAAGLVYYYNTSPVFAEYPQSNLLNPNIDALDDEKDHPTLDRLLESSRNKSQKDASVLQSALETSSQRSAGPMHMNAQAETLQGSTDTSSATSSAAEMEAEAEGEGAFNPVTGEINWDCPCLGGMAYGPCGEEFRTAFSCFVYSTAEPKGMDCVEKFGAMQECFRAHPEVYKGELEDDEALDGEMEGEKELLRKEIEERREQVAHKQKNLLDEPDRPGVSLATEAEAKAKQGSTQPLPQPHTTSTKTPQPEAKTTSHTPGEYSASKETEHGASSQTIRHAKTKGTDANATPESEELVPKAAHDARNTSVKDSHSSVRS